VCPTAQVFIGCEAKRTPPHCWQWVANGKSSVVHKGLLAAGKVIATTVYDLLTKPELIEQVKKVQTNSRQQRVSICYSSRYYVSLIEFTT